MARVTKDPQIRIAEILDAANRLFNTKGYHETQVSDIVKEIGVAQGTFYYYFKSKDEVLEAMVRQQIAEVIAKIEAVTATSNITAPRKIELIVGAIFKSIRGENGLLFEFLHNDQYVHILDKIGRQGEQLVSPLLLKVVEEGIGEGCFKVERPKETVDFIAAIIECLIDALYETHEDDLAYRLRIAEKLIETSLDATRGILRLSVSE